MEEEEEMVTVVEEDDDEGTQELGTRLISWGSISGTSSVQNPLVTNSIGHSIEPFPMLLFSFLA